MKHPTDQQFQELRHLVECTSTIISYQSEKDGGANSDNGSVTDEDSGSDDGDTSGIVPELRSQIVHLQELGPTVQRNLLLTQKAGVESSYPPVVPFHLSDPANIYVSLVREKFKHAEDQLIDRLGESNWQRHKIVRERMESVKRHPEEANERMEQNRFVHDQDVPYSAFRPYATFHDSGIGTSVPAHTEYALSHTSFQSSNSDGEHGSMRVPPTPVEVSAGKPFQCAFCGCTLLGIKNRIDWKSVSMKYFRELRLIQTIIRMHVFADLRPYICTFASCEKELTQFSTRAAWADHEFTEHRIIRSWSCPECPKQSDSEIEWLQHLETCHERTFLGHKQQIAKKMAYTTQAKPAQDEECPLCLVILGKPRRAFVKHVGRHMEEIALVALPRDDSEESEVQSVSLKSESCSSPRPVAQGPETKGIGLHHSGSLPGSGAIAPEGPSTQDHVQPQPLMPRHLPDCLGSDHATLGSVHTPPSLLYEDEDEDEEDKDEDEDEDAFLAVPKYQHETHVLHPNQTYGFICTSLVIGTWRYVPPKQYELRVVCNPYQEILKYYINKDEADYVIECPYSYIKNTSLENRDTSQESSERCSRLLIELHRAPIFFRKNQDSTLRSRCEDFTEDQQASAILVHYLEGPTIILRQVLESISTFHNAPEVSYF